MFEWQRASQDAKKTPHYNDLLKFLDLRAQASENCSIEPRRYHQMRKPFPKSAASFVANSDAPNCSLCKSIPYTLVRSSGCSPTTRCCPLSVQATYVSIVSDQVTSRGIVEATTVAENVRSHTTHCFTVIQTQLQKTTNGLCLPRRKNPLL